MGGGGWERGRSLAGLIAGLASLGLLAGAAAPIHGAWRARAVESAAQEFAALLRELSVAAVSDGRDRAVVFPPPPASEPFRVARDGDGDGVDPADVASGVDPALPGRSLLPGAGPVRIGNPGWPGLPSPPPSRAAFDTGRDAVRFGARRMAVLTADGHATPGSVLVTDDERFVCQVVVHGATVRVRVWCTERSAARWRLR